MDKDWTIYRTKHRTSHFRQTHFGTKTRTGHNSFGVDRGQKEMAKIGDTEIDNSHDKVDMGKFIGVSSVRLMDSSLILSKYKILKRT